MTKKGKESAEWPRNSEGEWEMMLDELIDALYVVIGHPCTPPLMAQEMGEWLPRLRERFPFTVEDNVLMGTIFAHTTGRVVLRAAAQIAREAQPEKAPRVE